MTILWEKPTIERIHLYSVTKSASTTGNDGQGGGGEGSGQDNRGS